MQEKRSQKAIRNRLCFLFLAAMTACQYGETELAEDNDTDKGTVAEAVEEAPDTTFATSYYKAWDVDGDGFLNEEEFTSGFFKTWDLNNDGRISNGEWSRVISDRTKSIDAKNWKPWDTDGDGFIERVEFDVAFPKMGWYGTWDIDGDGLIEELEYTTGTDGFWDTEAEEVLDETQ